MNPLSSSINEYTQLAQEGIKDFQAKGDRKTVKVLKEQIKKLHAVEKEIKAAQKVDSAFMKFLKAAFWVMTSPIWVLPYAIKKLFVKEYSQEERIQQIANKILMHIPKTKIQLQKLRDFSGIESKTEELKENVRELLAGLKIDASLVDFQGKSDVKVVDSFNRDFHRFSYMTIQEEFFAQGKAFGQENERSYERSYSAYQKLKGIVGTRGLIPVMNLAHQGMIAEPVINLMTNVVPQLSNELNLDANVYGVESFFKGDLGDLGNRLEIFKDTESRVHICYTVVKLLADESNGALTIENAIGLIAVEREVVIPVDELSNFQAAYLLKLEGNDVNTLDANLTSNLQVIDRVSSIYDIRTESNVREGVKKAHDDAFNDLKNKRISS